MTMLTTFFVMARINIIILFTYITQISNNIAVISDNKSRNISRGSLCDNFANKVKLNIHQGSSSHHSAHHASSSRIAKNVEKEVLESENKVDLRANLEEDKTGTVEDKSKKIIDDNPLAIIPYKGQQKIKKGKERKKKFKRAKAEFPYNKLKEQPVALLARLPPRRSNYELRKLSFLQNLRKQVSKPLKEMREERRKSRMMMKELEREGKIVRNTSVREFTRYLPEINLQHLTFPLNQPVDQVLWEQMFASILLEKKVEWGEEDRLEMPSQETIRACKDIQRYLLQEYPSASILLGTYLFYGFTWYFPTEIPKTIMVEFIEIDSEIRALKCVLDKSKKSIYVMEGLVNTKNDWFYILVKDEKSSPPNKTYLSVRDVVIYENERDDKNAILSRRFMTFDGPTDKELIRLKAEDDFRKTIVEIEF